MSDNTVSPKGNMGACIPAGLLLYEGGEGVILRSTNAVPVHRETQLCAMSVLFFFSVLYKLQHLQQSILRNQKTSVLS